MTHFPLSKILPLVLSITKIALPTQQPSPKFNRPHHTVTLTIASHRDVPFHIAASSKSPGLTILHPISFTSTVILPLLHRHGQIVAYTSRHPVTKFFKTAVSITRSPLSENSAPHLQPQRRAMHSPRLCTVEPERLQLMTNHLLHTVPRAPECLRTGTFYSKFPCPQRRWQVRSATDLYCYSHTNQQLDAHTSCKSPKIYYSI